MKKIRTHSDFERIKQEYLKKSSGRTIVLRTCLSTGCRSQKSVAVSEALWSSIEKKGLQDKIEIKQTGCHGFCEMGPIMVVEPQNIFYKKVTPDDTDEIIEMAANGGGVIDRLLWKDPVTKETVKCERELPLYKNQKKNVTYKSGRIDPKDIRDYIAAGGYEALIKVISTMTPDEVIDEIIASGLRGRGGGGFPTGVKWKICSESPGDIKYIIANGDEGDPGAFMDRSLMEGDPHSIIEGMIIGAYAIGAVQGFIYVRDEYPIAIDHLSGAITDAEEYGFLGNNILDSGFSLSLKIKRGAGAFVCGEETALIISIEGRSGMPRSRPPYPAVEGLWGKPTVINNVETFGNVPLIISRGREWYADTGTKNSKGTKVFSLVGKVRNTGLVEVEMGTTLREIVFDIGGGIRRDRSFKAVQTGGPSGGCIPMSRIDMPVDYDSLREAGAIMGSGGIIVMDETSCMVDVARYFVGFLMGESCGKCVPCREGLQQMYRILENISEGNGEEGDIDALLEVGQFMKTTSLCGLGGTASNPVLSTLRHFKSEYESHIFEKKCTAGVCKNLFDYYIDDKLCTGCSLCRIKCPEKAIEGKKKEPHVLDKAKCIKCSICFNSCKYGAILIT
ncbi:MAG: NADH-quinone oxidoreductase subunit NuoF [Nitrospirota bacterium]|nr:MAG: NADH-quinone oxidoreductase subunit NuoF [Nitrospirota bacterium]